MNNWAFSKIWILIILIIFAWQYFVAPEEVEVPEPEEVKVPEELIEDETVELKTYKIYNSGQEIMGFSLNIPQGWRVNFKESLPLSIAFDFAPPDWHAPIITNGWMGWGSIFVHIYDYQSDINKWIAENLAEYKGELIVTKEDSIGGKPTFLLDRKPGEFWVPRYVILGNEHSYVLGVFQDGADNFTQILEEEIFPNITIK